MSLVIKIYNFNPNNWSINMTAVNVEHELKPEDLLELRLINKIVSTEDLESTCLHKLRRLVRIPKHALVEARSMLQPNIDEVLKHIDSGLKSSLRSIYKMKP
jgi:enoyl-CoA hydratase/carnithine racemase